MYEDVSAVTKVSDHTSLVDTPILIGLVGMEDESCESSNAYTHARLLNHCAGRLRFCVQSV